MRRTFLAALALAAVLPAQTQYLVSPLGLDTLEGGTNNNYPFYNNLFTYQQVHDDLVGRPRVITELAFRKDGALSSAVAARSFTVTLRLSSTMLTASQAGTVFANNHGQDLTEVVTSTVINWPAEAVPVPPPAPFSFNIPFPAKPFVYKNTPGLCWEIRIHVAPTATGSCDATTTTAPYQRYGLGCMAAGQASNAYLLAYPAANMTTSAWTFTCTGRYLGKSQPAFWLLGESDQRWLGLPLPLDLGPFGLTGCSLYTSMLVSIPGTTDANGSLSIAGVSLPYDPALQGVAIFSQAFSTDTGPSPLVFTDGCKAIFLWPLVARIYASGSDTATSGSKGYPYGLVTRFAY